MARNPSDGYARVMALRDERACVVVRVERVEVVDSLPVTGLGKVDKAALRADIAAKLERRGELG